VEVPAESQLLWRYRHARVGYFPSQTLNDQKVFDSVWREAVMRMRPDPNPGQDSLDFRRTLTARDRLKQLKGWQ